jgi:hypothetical protein
VLAAFKRVEYVFSSTLTGRVAAIQGRVASAGPWLSLSADEGAEVIVAAARSSRRLAATRDDGHCVLRPPVRFRRWPAGRLLVGVEVVEAGCGNGPGIAVSEGVDHLMVGVFASGCVRRARRPGR